MPEEEKNRYFEQARQATLAEIAGNQQALVEQQAAQGVAPAADVQQQPVVQPEEAPLPAGPALPTAPAVMQAQEQPVGLDDWMNGIESQIAARQREREMAKILDPRAQRAENSRKWIAGIGDALASMANMIGTGHDAANQQQTYMLPGVNEALEQDRARRTAQYQKQLDQMNQLMMQQYKDAAADARQQKQIEAADKRAADDRAAREKQNEAANKLARDKFEADKAKQDEANKLAARRQDETERHNRVSENLDRQRVAKMKDNRIPDGTGAEGGADNGGGRYSGKKGGGIKEAKVDYNAMLDEIAERNGCVDWADLSNRKNNDRNLRNIYNQFDLSKDKAGAAKIEGMISHYAKDWAPEFHKFYFGGGKVDDGIDFNGFKPGAPNAQTNNSGYQNTTGGTLESIMSSTPDSGRKKKREK